MFSYLLTRLHLQTDISSYKTCILKRQLYFLQNRNQFAMTDGQLCSDKTSKQSKQRRLCNFLWLQKGKEVELRQSTLQRQNCLLPVFVGVVHNITVAKSIFKRSDSETAYMLLCALNPVFPFCLCVTICEAITRETFGTRNRGIQAHYFRLSAFFAEMKRNK